MPTDVKAPELDALILETGSYTVHTRLTTTDRHAYTHIRFLSVTTPIQAEPGRDSRDSGKDLNERPAR